MSFDLNSSWFRVDLFPARTIKHGGRGDYLILSSGAVHDELTTAALYVAYLQAAGGDRRVVVQVRPADLLDDSPAAVQTKSFRVRMRGGQLRVSTATDGRRTDREVIASFAGDEDEEHLIDFIVRIDKHIVPFLEGRK